MSTYFWPGDDSVIKRTSPPVVCFRSRVITDQSATVNTSHMDWRETHSFTHSCSDPPLLAMTSWLRQSQRSLTTHLHSVILAPQTYRVHTHTHMHTCAHTHIPRHTNTHTCTYIHKYTHTRTHTLVKTSCNVVIVWRPDAAVITDYRRTQRRHRSSTWRSLPLPPPSLTHSEQYQHTHSRKLHSSLQQFLSAHFFLIG